MTQKGPTMKQDVEQGARIMTQAAAADIVEQARAHRSWRDSHGELSELPHRMAAEIERLYTLARANNDLARLHAGTIKTLRAREAETQRKLDDALEALESNQLTACNHGGAVNTDPYAELATIHRTATDAITSIRGETE